MGSQATKAIRARRRKAAARVERLIAGANAGNPDTAAARQRILATARTARQRLRALESTRRSLAAKETEVGEAILALTDEGITSNDAYRLLDLSCAIGRRYVDIALRTGGNGRRSSTAEPGHAATAAYDGKHPNDKPGTGPPLEGMNR